MFALTSVLITALLSLLNSNKFIIVVNSIIIIILLGNKISLGRKQYVSWPFFWYFACWLTCDCQFFSLFQARYNEITSDATYLDKVLSEGARKAANIADATLNNVYQAMGFLPRWAELMLHPWKKAAGKQPYRHLSNNPIDALEFWFFS